MLKSSKVFLKKTKNIKPDVAVILGSGLTNFFEKKNIIKLISYRELPNFPEPTVKGHLGKVVLGKIKSHNILCLHGRSHIYEGINTNSLKTPIRFLKDIGCKLIIITNAAGSIHKSIKPGSIMSIKDHINWSGFNPLIGPNEDDYGPRFSDMSDPYDKFYRKQLKKIAKKINQKIYEGTYCMFSGPSFETPAEIKAMRTLGVSAVGMSTVPEVIIANHCSLPVVALSVITNQAAGISKNKLSHKETLEQAALVEKKILKLIKNFIKELIFYDTTRNN
ncbi:MAG: Purine nucleoside phosphorylase 1 [Alphaproteobacteria bacterium MarineAlpha5_Bin9]|nr:MAG: Purine nucleoside phosphorylase 1 [Alphaproteobacteria bacterium MarineAlpha5_Bin9]|tara:strand:- start:6452 stop:7282 length:831 start_codon:yes stop_codon:yes gene_type:complete